MRNIVIYRTSTIRQEAEEQRKETLEYAKSFLAENIVEVGGEGLSAIKLDDQYVKNIEKVFDLIAEGDIQCVYAWSIDRIGRNEELLMKFKNRLIENKVQLRIKNPTLQLLNDDGTVNSGMEIAFSLFSTMAKQEMELKQKRFKRAKNRNKSEGKYNGGKVKFGYAVDKDGYYIEGETAVHVREIFRKYAFTPVSINHLSVEYTSNGVLQTSPKTAASLINRMLKDKGYIGETFYPRLVDDGTFYKVQEKLKEYRILPKVKYKVAPYYLQGLIYDLGEDGYEMHRMRVKKSEVAYMSYTEKFSLNINLVDSLVIQVLNDMIAKSDFQAFQSTIEKRVEQLSNEIEKVTQEAEKVAKRGDMLDERHFVLGTVRNYDRMRKEIDLKVEELKKRADLLEETRLKLIGEKDRVLNVDLYSLDDTGRREVVMEYVQRVLARKVDRWCSVLYIECQSSPLGMSCTVMYDRHRKAFTYMDGNWIGIKVIRSIQGRSRSKW